MRALGFRVETLWQCELAKKDLTAELGQSLRKMPGATSR